MKIKALVTIVAKTVEGKTVSLEPGKNDVGDIQQDVAEKLIAEGYAEKAKKKDEINAKTAPFGGAATKKRKTAQQVVTDSRSETEKTKDKKRRTKEQLLGGGRDPDKNVGEDGRRNDGTDDDEGSED